MAEKYDNEYEQLPIPAGGPELLALASRILRRHAEGCNIPSPPDPGKAGVVYTLFRYGLSKGDLDWRKYPWLALQRGEGMPSSSKGQPDLPPVHVFADGDRAKAWWNPAVTLDQALFHLRQMGLATKDLSEEALRKRLVRADPPVIWINKGGLGRGHAASLRLVEVFRVFGIPPRDASSAP